MKKISTLSVVIIILVLGLIVGGQCLVVTYPNEYTVIKQFGKIESIRKTPGLSYKTPFIQTAEKIENETLLYDLAVSDVMTKIHDCGLLCIVENYRSSEIHTDLKRTEE